MRGASAVGDERLYLFLDNCSVHHANETKPHFERLNIEPVWNVAYKFQYNSAIEMYWAQLKSAFRPILLNKMLKVPRAKDTPLRDAVHEAIKLTPTTSIPKYVKKGDDFLEQDALEILQEMDQNEV